MNRFRRTPSKWLLYNSNGFPDFLFTVLTYSMILLAFVTLTWVAFSVLATIHANDPGVEHIQEVASSMRAGLVSLAGVVFGLAGSYTVRRFKKDDHYVEKRTMEMEFGVGDGEAGTADLVEAGLRVVESEEDI